MFPDERGIGSVGKGAIKASDKLEARETDPASELGSLSMDAGPVDGCLESE